MNPSPLSQEQASCSCRGRFENGSLIGRQRSSWIAVARDATETLSIPGSRSPLPFLVRPVTTQRDIRSVR